MFLLAHLALGLIIGKLTQNYPIALIGALFVDVDHLLPFIRHKILFSWKKFWKTITNPKSYPNLDKRNYLHSIFAFISINSATFLFEYRAWLIGALSDCGH